MDNAFKLHWLKYFSRYLGPDDAPGLFDSLYESFTKLLDREFSSSLLSEFNWDLLKKILLSMPTYQEKYYDLFCINILGHVILGFSNRNFTMATTAKQRKSYRLLIYHMLINFNSANPMFMIMVCEIGFYILDKFLENKFQILNTNTNPKWLDIPVGIPLQRVIYKLKIQTPEFTQLVFLTMNPQYYITPIYRKIIYNLYNGDTIYFTVITSMQKYFEEYHKYNRGLPQYLKFSTLYYFIPMIITEDKIKKIRRKINWKKIKKCKTFAMLSSFFQTVLIQTRNAAIKSLKTHDVIFSYKYEDECDGSL